MNAGQPVRVGVVAADPMRRIGLQAILEETAGVGSCAVALEEALVAEDLSAVLLDGTSVANLTDALGRFRRERPAAKVVVLGDQLGADDIQAVIAAGAKGYLPESASESEIRMALEVVLDGSVWAPRKVLAKLIEAGGVTFSAGAKAENCSGQMTGREREVLRLLMDGRTNRQIAHTMGIESVTVKAHLGRMLRKAGVKNRVELTVKALAEAPDRGNGR